MWDCRSAKTCLTLHRRLTLRLKALELRQMSATEQQIHSEWSRCLSSFPLLPIWSVFSDSTVWCTCVPDVVIGVHCNSITRRHCYNGWRALATLTCVEVYTALKVFMLMSLVEVAQDMLGTAEYCASLLKRVLTSPTFALCMQHKLTKNPQIMANSWRAYRHL